MPVDRPTFSESWYRVATLRPRLRSTVQVHRQHFRGQTWHVLQDPANNQFFRLNESAYHFIALLDGRRTVADVWQACNEQLGDNAPTQGEAIQLLGQLYTSNLLHCELPPDAESLFHRYRRRTTREIQSQLANILFLRIPLYDPDHLLNRWVRVVGKLFTLPGFIFWLALIAIGFYFLTGRWNELWERGASVLDQSNIVYLYIAMVLIKVCHEFGHAFSCKRFGTVSGTGGEVHVIGIMFLVFTPLPYVDASSSWAFQSKWHRSIVGAAGMMVELGVAAIAAIIWSQTGTTSVIHQIMYNMLFIAGVSTILFNANPLLRYDGYYILSDILEIPNLSQRGKEYLYYLVRRYIYGVRKPRNPAHTPGEKFWLFIYAVASTIYRIVVCVAILLFIAQKLFFVGVLLAAGAAFTWGMIPLGKFVHYLATNNELDRVRIRAIAATLLVVAAAIAGIGIIPSPGYCRIEGIVEPERVVYIYPEADFFLRRVDTPSGSRVEAQHALFVGDNQELQAAYDRLVWRRKELEVQKRIAESEQHFSDSQSLTQLIAAQDKQIARAKQELDDCTVRAPIDGVFVAPDIEYRVNSWVNRGDFAGIVASNEMQIRAIAGQDVAAALKDKVHQRVQIRIKGRSPAGSIISWFDGDDKPQEIEGTIESISLAGQDQLPSPALGFAAGGSTQTQADDRQGTKTSEQFFEIRIKPDAKTPTAVIAENSNSPLRLGERVIVRMQLSSETLIVQWWRSALRLFQRRFQI